jgi:transcriptional regulator with XRE-family HTH domain
MTKQHFQPAPAAAGAEPGPTQALVQRLLQKYGLSQGALKRATGIDQSRLSRYARGIVPPALDDVFKLQALERELEQKAQQQASQAPTPAPTSG